MSARLVRLKWLSLTILVTLLLQGCSTATPSAPPVSAAATTGCPDALGPIAAPIVAAAGNNLIAIKENGSGQSWLLPLSQEASAAFPSWSPDGQTLAYALRYPAPSPKLRGITSVICGIERATGKGRLLAAGQQDDWLDEPVWSSDGQAVLLTLTRFEPGPDQQPVDRQHVARYDLKAGTLQVLVADAHSPAPSSAGDRLLYVAVDPTSQNETLFVARPDGQEARPLITLERPYVSAMWPRWSPDDTRILFGASMVRGEEDERYVPAIVGADGQGFQPLGKDLNNVVSLDWAPDSRRLVYATSGTGLFIRDLRQHEARNLTRAGDGMGVTWARR
ncbi:MAG TPA: hypothetical protein VFZ66_28470 [Herpetosiphonaceae bacterium]